MQSIPGIAMADTLRIMCPNLSCRKILAVPASARGKTVKCRACSMTIKIPTVSSTPTARPAPPCE